MISETWYWYVTDDGHEYKVFIHWHLNGRKPYCEGMDLYSKKDRYKGFWHRAEMPSRVVKWAETTMHRDEVISLLNKINNKASGGNLL